ncbi:MAG: PorV/PorQ family protein, partial [Pedobacter sp.]
MKSSRRLTLLIIGYLFLSTQVQAQVFVGGSQTNGSGSSNIITAVPFLLIVPDARTGAMGNAGVATSGDANAASINPAKLSFLDKDYGVALSYSPWLKSIVPNVSLSYLSGFYKLDERNTIAASLRYFSLGEVQLTDINQQPLGVSNPNEIAADLTLSRSFGTDFALAGTFRFISSNLTSGLSSASSPARAGTAVSVDVAGLYKSPTSLFG